MSSPTFLLSMPPNDPMLGEILRMCDESDFSLSLAPSDLMLGKISRMCEKYKIVLCPHQELQNESLLDMSVG